ncbi:MAG: endolytic transglycosylase MltG, partial [Alphaproteobacteria bacterium]|nr:endolytic transglycosylase MltG [Alphaproteobacteria bacterium]
AGGIAWFHQAVDAPGPLAEKRTVTIPPGDSSRMIADRLEQQGIISGQSVFLVQVMSQDAIARASGKPARHMKAGEYEMEPGISIRKVIQKLTEGRSLLYSVTMPEGLTSFEIVRRLINDPNLSGEIAQVPPEGSLLPETFSVPRNTSRSQVLALLSREQDTFLSAKWAERMPDLPLKSKEEALVLASMVEKESGPNDDPARIAAVFINRLKRGMRLQSDPTILYGKHGPKVQWGAKIYRSDINAKTAHNTYQIDGLPPTPICNPGRRSIEAVLQPATSKELYFVANGKGGHIFSETLQEHEAAVKNWRKIEREIRAEERTAEAVETTSADVAPTLINSKQVPAVSVVSPPQGAPSDRVPLPVKRPQQ